ncbi:Z1 domain-containing protein [Williamsia sp. SKLECPSW1]
MDTEFARQTLIDRMRRHGETIDKAAESISRGMGVALSELKPAVESIRREGSRNMLLDTPPGVFADGPSLEDEARLVGWYTGPEAGDEIWPRLKKKLDSGSMRDVVDEIDNASTKVVAHLADPNVRNLSKRGLVLGYVQSGKTANYTAVMAKAADAGYCLFIVLSGLHNNLRRQTQVRLSKDIIDDDWVPLTSDTADFGNIVNGTAFLGRGVKSIAVVKKNPARLKKLRNWLRNVPIDIRRRTPILLLDDEADQATPNSASSADQVTKINQLIKEIWAEIPTGTYVGYTATPFANIFMNPNDEEDLYPEDFILDLPRPAAYFGAERVFGREPQDETDSPDPGLDVVRDISDDDAAALRPPSNADARSTFSPKLPNSLADATVWFLLATAIRRCRGQYDAHSSMLVHTTHYIHPHFALRDRIESLLNTLRVEAADENSTRFRESFDHEALRAREIATLPLPRWDEVVEALTRVIQDVRVVVDNGASDDRLDYSGKLAETVIAVGGGTLSRGLTLEGLVVSYFTRTSNTYDTLLQMGRWFGYRPGYEDLPRVWMQPSLAEEFRFLALVEHELRQDILDMEKQQLTPRELGVRVRAHPGRLAIVARNKMRWASIVEMSYSGQRLQTFIFSEADQNIIERNRQAALQFVGSESGLWVRDEKNRQRWVARNLPASKVTNLLRQYTFHENQLGMRADHMIGWIEKVAQNSQWNAVVIGNSRLGGEASLESSADLGVLGRVRTLNRAPLKHPPAGQGVANIKALMSHNDWFADIGRDELKGEDSSATPRQIRRKYCSGNGLIAIYPVDRRSHPMGTEQTAGNRRNMEAPDHLIGIGIIFPETDRQGFASPGTYYSVRPDWQWSVDPDDDQLPDDTEGDLNLDGDQVANSI